MTPRNGWRGVPEAAPTFSNSNRRLSEARALASEPSSSVLMLVPVSSLPRPPLKAPTLR
jgi:hypothetical protein